MEKKFKYDAFISYRHTELDKFVAETIHKKLEAFRLPSNLAKKRPGQKNRIERVFRDKEELPLTSNLEDPILAALNDSEWLIVICSPRLRDSMWCKKEIETFVTLRGRDHVLAVLVEGEPKDSFPDELLFREEENILPNGTKEIVKIPVEPLAADVRGKNQKEIKKALNNEILRILAAMFDLSFDDLRQRHKERRMRRIVTASLLAGGACLAFGVYSTVTAMRIQAQKEQIEVQAEEIKLQSAEIQKQNSELSLRQAKSLVELSKRYLEEGDRENALLTVKESLTTSGGIQMPYTPQAQLVLADCVRAYDLGITYQADYQYVTAGRIEAVKCSDDRNTLCIYDQTGFLTLYDLESREELLTISADECADTGKDAFQFVGENMFAYINEDDEVCLIDITSKQEVGRKYVEDALLLKTDKKGNYLALQQIGSHFTILDGQTLEEKCSLEVKGKGLYTDEAYMFEDGVFAVSNNIGQNENKEDLFSLSFYDADTGAILSTCDLGVYELKDMVVKGGVAYLSTGYYQNAYTYCDTKAMAIQVADAKVVWEYEARGAYPYDICYPGCENPQDLLLCLDDSIVLLNIETGRATNTQMLPSREIRVNAYVNSNNFLIFTEDGEMVLYRQDEGELYDMSWMFPCTTARNKEIYFTKSGICVWAFNDNRVTVYTEYVGPGVKETETDFDYPATKNQNLNGIKAREAAHSFGLDRADYVNTVFYSPDEAYAFIEYFDSTLTVYDVNKKSVVNTMENMEFGCQWCIGTDVDGCTYIGGFNGVYVLNADMEPIARIDKAVNVDLKEKKVFLKHYDNTYEAPIYGVDELLSLVNR